MSFSVFVMISSMTVTIVAKELTSVVNTTSGPVQGQILSTAVEYMEYASFVGIRYGKAPIGYLRFKPPVLVEPWTEILDATVEGDKCTQTDPVKGEISGSEDCLFLNIATPVTNLEEIPENLKAVIVWIHGGAFLYGTSSFEEYRPDNLIEKDVVFVSVNYRLGAFGFLTLNHPNASGNAGLKDQNLALKWIQANIKNFGGNPNNVTLLGQSSGAAAVGFHTLSDASVGLFHGAISMSGTALMTWAFKTPQKSLIAAKNLGTFMGTKSHDKETLLNTFYTASAEELVKASAIVSRVSPFLPTIEDAALDDIFLSTCSIDKYQSGNFTKVPQILGFVQKETLLYFTSSPSVKQIIPRALQDYPSQVLYDIIHSLPVLESVAEHRNSQLFDAAVNETTDILFKSLIDITQSLLVANNEEKPVYYYEFTFSPNISLHNLETDRKIDGAAHNDDLPYLFWNPLITGNLGFYSPIFRTVYRLTTMWTNFAKYGHPTPYWMEGCSMGVIWPNSGSSGCALEIGSELTVTERPITLNTEIIKSAMLENISMKNGCSVTTYGNLCRNY